MEEPRRRRARSQREGGQYHPHLCARCAPCGEPGEPGESELRRAVHRDERGDCGPRGGRRLVHSKQRAQSITQGTTQQQHAAREVLVLFGAGCLAASLRTSTVSALPSTPLGDRHPWWPASPMPCWAVAGCTATARSRLRLRTTRTRAGWAAWSSRRSGKRWRPSSRPRPRRASRGT